MKSRINKYLDELVKEGVIKEWYFDNFQYWQGISFIQLNNGKKVPLAKTNYYMRSLIVKTIYDYKNITYVKEKIQNTIENGYFD